MLRILVVVDMQNDFISGSLGSEAAKKVVPNVVEKIRNWNGPVIATCDTHDTLYLDSLEGEKLPVEHCIGNTWGWLYEDSVRAALREKEEDGLFFGFIEKSTFGSLDLPDAIEQIIDEYEECEYNTAIQLVGLDTDICVVSNALILKACSLCTSMSIDSTCCAGTTPEAHEAALIVAKSCQIDVI